MLYLIENKNDGKTFYLLNQTEFVVGRKDCDILLQNDQSISRKHAIIRIKDNHVTLEDCGSKYKTLHRDVEIAPNVEIRLKNNDVIQFGVIASQYIFKQLNFVTTGTRLSGTRKAKLKKEIALLGGLFTENWTSECTHLTVEEITLTVKVLHALIDEKLIVVPAYWTKFAENVARNLPPPNIEEYRDPPMAEALLNKVEFKSNVSRKQLFKGKLFMFLKEKSKKQMEDIIKKVGGQPMSWEKNPMPVEDILSTPKEFLLIQAPDQEEDRSFNDIIKHFTKKGKRTIPLQEIAMAIVHGSCEKDCNPDFNRVEEVFPTTRAREPTQNNALVQNTESEYFSMDICKVEETRMIIPDTFDPSIEPIRREKTKPGPSWEAVPEKDSMKRVRTEREKENPFKKIKVEKEKIVSSETSLQEKKSAKEDKPKQTLDNFISKTVLSQKRKAEEEPSIIESGKNKNVNPFALIMKKSRKEPEPTSKKVNPFSLTKKSSSEPTQIPDDNPFKLLTRKTSDEENSRNPMTSTRLDDKSPDKTYTYSKLSKTNSSEMNGTWLSKETPSEVKTDEQYDEQMQSFIDLFRDTVVVEVMANISVRSRVTGDVSYGISCGSGKNFKKFKKVRPLYPQSTIIGKENLVAKGPGGTAGINDTRSVLPDSDDESVAKINKKRPPKKFFL